MNRKREKSLNGFSKYCKTPEEVISGVKNHISKTDKFAFLCGFFMCLIINLFVYTNTCFVHDSIRIFDSSTGLNNGRLLVGPLMLLTNRVQLPWVIGLFSCVIMGFITVYFSKIFYIKNLFSIISMLLNLLKLIRLCKQQKPDDGLTHHPANLVLCIVALQYCFDSVYTII